MQKDGEEEARSSPGTSFFLPTSCLPNSFLENSATAWDRDAELPEGRLSPRGGRGAQITEAMCALPKQKWEEQKCPGGREAGGHDENAPTAPKDHPGLVRTEAGRRHKDSVLPS